jgi:hypothetical protein
MVIDVSRHDRRQYQGATVFVLVVAAFAAGAAGVGHGPGIVAAQASNPCALLTTDEIQPLAGNATIADGLPNSRAEGSVRCRYAWGEGTGRFTLDVSLNEAARVYPGVSPERIKQQLLESVRPETADAVIPDVGEAAVFRPDSPAYAGATAFIKGRILQVHLDGVYARDRKDQVIELLKLAAGRL